jgi:RNA polymerase sigma factor (sigma-70 family)
LDRGRRSGRRPDDQIGLRHIQPRIKQAGDDADQPGVARRSATTKDQRSLAHDWVFYATVRSETKFLVRHRCRFQGVDAWQPFWNFLRRAGHYVDVRSNFDGESDGDLWAQANAHDGAAFGELFERHSKSVYNHCFHLTGSWSVAEDLTSAVFLQAWRRRDQVKLHGDSILPWLLAVANNALRNSRRSIRRHRLLLAKLPRSDSSSAIDDGIGDRIDDERRMHSMLIIVNRLNVRERQIIALCDWSDLSYSEAAVALNIPIGTVRSRLFRAREHLQNLLADGTSQDSKTPFIGLDSAKDAHDFS